MEYIAIVLCLMGSAFFSGSEIAYTSLNKIRMKEDTDGLSLADKLMRYIYNHYDRALSTILIGNNIVNILASSMGTLLFIELLRDGSLAKWSSAISTAVLTVILLTFGEISPKTVAKKNPESFAMFSSPFISFLEAQAPSPFLLVLCKFLLPHSNRRRDKKR